MYTHEKDILIVFKICDAGIFCSEVFRKKSLWLVQSDRAAEPSVMTIHSSLSDISLFKENIFPFAKSGCSNSEIQKLLFLPLCLSSNYIIGSLQWGSGGGRISLWWHTVDAEQKWHLLPHMVQLLSIKQKKTTFPCWDGSRSIDPNTKGSSHAALSNI